MAEKMLDNNINIPPTMYKKQGEIIGILIGCDIDFSKVYKLKVNKCN
jgi:type IV secretion system protein VirB10